MVGGRVRPWREWTLRSRMVVSIVALASVALIVANVAAVLVLRSYLIDRVNAQLEGQAQAASHAVFGASGRGRPGFGQDFRVLLFGSDGTQYPTDPDGTIPDPATGPDLGTFTAITDHRDQGPYKVDGFDGAPWQVIVTSVGQSGYINIGALSLRDVVATQQNLVAIDGGVTALVLLLMGLAAASVVRIGMRPLTHMEQMATEIAGTDDLSHRADDVNPHTETGRLGSALNAMLVRIEAALEARTASEQRLRQFLADASHELRTPLTSIQGFAELYRRGGTPPGPELDEAMARIESEVVRMRVLVNDLLMLARLDEERPLARAPVDLLGVAAETVSDAHVRVPTRFVQLTALDDAFDTFEPVTVLGDADKLRQVATNLVSNALQHTGDNTRIVVRVGRPHHADPALPSVPPTVAMGRELAPDTPVAVLEVEDTGPGMTESDAARVFERLYRAERSRDRRLGGAGLGLAIVAAIVASHGGRVELTTSLGAGTRFRVLLPAVPSIDDLDEADSEVAPSQPTVDVEPLD